MSFYGDIENEHNNTVTVIRQARKEIMDNKVVHTKIVERQKMLKELLKDLNLTSMERYKLNQINNLLVILSDPNYNTVSGAKGWY